MCRCSVGCEYGTIIRLEDYGEVRFGTLKDYGEVRFWTLKDYGEVWFGLGH